MIVKLQISLLRWVTNTKIMQEPSNDKKDADWLEAKKLLSY